MKSNPPPIPRHFRLDWIERKAEQLWSLALPECNQPLTDAVRTKLVDWWSAALDPPRRYALESPLGLSLLAHAQELFTTELARRLARRLAANWPTLRVGQPVLPFSVQAQAEWLPGQLEDLQLAPDRSVTWTVRLLAGAAVDQRLTLRYSQRRCLRLARCLGFTLIDGSDPSLRYSHPRQLVQLRAWWLLVPGTPLRATDFAVTAQLTRHNQRLVQQRQRVRFRCPLAKPATFPCFRCPAGYAPDSTIHCPVACRLQPRHV